MSTASSPKQKKLTKTQKTFCRELAKNQLHPMRIYHALARKFEVPLETLPPLKAIQNFVNHYSRTKLENHDRVDDLRNWIHARAFTGSEPMSQPFTIGWELDLDGKPVVGNGSNVRTFIIGLTTKALILTMVVPPESFIFHIDATYKMNFVGYPVVVVGLSDRSRGFHLVALFVVSQETQPIFEAVLMSLRRLYYWITQKELFIHFAMADGDQAQYNALQSVFGGNPNFQFLMCFFSWHGKVHKKIKGFPSRVAAAIVGEVYDLHFCRSESEFLEAWDQILSSWMSNPFLFEFARYMSGQWRFGRFCTWQAYLTQSGFATTNNPAETFNALLKRHYTLRRRLKMGALLRELSACCEDQSSKTRPFRYEVVPAATLVRRVTDLTRANLLGVSNGDLLGNECAGRSSSVCVLSRLAKRVSLAPNNRSEVGIAVSAQMGEHYARMEVQGQPWCGWRVDVINKWCGCNYFYVFGVCIHLLYALRMTDYVDIRGRNILVCRTKRNHACGGDNNQGGRVRSIGPALSLE